MSCNDMRDKSSAKMSGSDNYSEKNMSAANKEQSTKETSSEKSSSKSGGCGCSRNY